MKTCKEKALEWNVSPRSVNDMCKKGRIQGAIKEKGSWLIPDDSPKPMDNQYKIKSNRESGDGRFDVSLIPREKRYPGIILELKWKEKLSDVELEKWSNEALKQIGELRYDSEMKEDGITEILKFGIAFSGKKVCVRTE